MLCLSDILRGRHARRACRVAPTRHAGPRGVRVARAAVQRGAGALLRRLRGPRRGRLDGRRGCARAALASARAVGNTSLEGIVYINLGVTYTTLGNRDEGPRLLSPELSRLPSARGDERRAAYSRANAGALLIEFGSPPDEGRRFVEGALRVVRNLGDRNFEVFCLQLIAVHDRLHRPAGRGRARASPRRSRSRGSAASPTAIPSLLLDDGRTLMDMGEYAGGALHIRDGADERGRQRGAGAADRAGASANASRRFRRAPPARSNRRTPLPAPPRRALRRAWRPPSANWRTPRAARRRRARRSSAPRACGPTTCPMRRASRRAPMPASSTISMAANSGRQAVTDATAAGCAHEASGARGDDPDAARAARTPRPPRRSRLGRRRRRAGGAARPRAAGRRCTIGGPKRGDALDAGVG